MTRKHFVRFLLQNIETTTRILKQIKPDLVHLHVQHYLSPAIMSRRLPYVLTSWGIEILSLPRTNIFFRTSAKLTARRARIVTVDARCLREIWVRNGIAKSKIKVIPFGVDTAFFNPNINGATVRSRLQIEDDAITIISTRPFYDHHYDVERLIRAIPLVLKTHSNAKFIIKGTGPFEGYLKALAAKLDISKSVRFVGIVPYDQIARYLSAANIYVSTCVFDSTSVSLLEAMACGLAPVVTDIPGNREWVKNGVNGFLFPSNNHVKLAEKIGQLIENEQLRESFGKKCVEVIKEKATWVKCVSEMEAIYESIL